MVARTTLNEINDLYVKLFYREKIENVLLKKRIELLEEKATILETMLESKKDP